MGIEGNSGGANSSEKKDQPQDILAKNIERFKQSQGYGNIPVSLKEGMEGGSAGSFLQAAERFKLLEHWRQATGLSAQDMELVADSENPYRLMKFSKEDHLRLSEIKRAIITAQQAKSQAN